MANTSLTAYNAIPDVILMNGKGPFGYQMTREPESFTVTKGKQKMKMRKFLLLLIYFSFLFLYIFKIWSIRPLVHMTHVSSMNTHTQWVLLLCYEGMTYRFRISNVGSVFSFNFRIQNHKMVLVETEGSYTNQITLRSLDVHVGQSYSVLVTADQNEADYYIVASPKLISTNDSSTLVGLGVLHYSNSKSQVTGPLPIGPDPFDLDFSMNQAKSVR